jgi:TM2 domain-containing membrane protein YozV
MIFRNLPVLILTFMCTAAMLEAEGPDTGLADYYVEYGLYGEAVTEYLRVIFFNQQTGGLDVIYSKIARCYAELEEWRNAERSLRKAMELAPDAEQAREYAFSLVEILIAQKSYKRALSGLQEMSAQSGDRDIGRRILFLQAVVYIYLYDWANAADCLGGYMDGSPAMTEERKAEIRKLLDTARHLPYKSKDLALFLSLILPGAGQAYAGDAGQALNALLVNGAAGTLTVYTAIEGYYLDAGILFLFVFYRYYQGNLYHAQRLAREYNLALNNGIAKKLLALLAEPVN